MPQSSKKLNLKKQLKKNKEVIPVKEQDFLEEDDEIRTQQFACVSFIDPDEIVKTKEVYLFENFMKSFSNDMNHLFSTLKEKYSDIDNVGIFNTIQNHYEYVFKNEIQDEFNYFKKNKAEDLETEYYKTQGCIPTKRGFKIRGSYQTMEEAKLRAKKLQAKDKNFHIHIAQVGCWCLFNPNEDDIEDQEYAYDELNTMMKQYRDNRKKADEHYEERKNSMIEQNKEDQEMKKKMLETIEEDSNENKGSGELINEVNNVVAESNKNAMNIGDNIVSNDDPWMQNKEQGSEQIKQSGSIEIDPDINIINKSSD